jgi:hypothetical protein
MVRSGLLKMLAGIEYLRSMDGQKHVIYLGRPFPMRDMDDERRLAQYANHAGVTLSMVNTEGQRIGDLATLRNVVVQARPGYHASPSAADVPELDVMAQARLEAAIVHEITATDIAIDPSKLTLVEAAGGVRSTRLGVTVMGINSRRQRLGGGTRTLDVNATPETYQQYVTGGIPMSVTFPVADRPWQVRAIVYENESGLMPTYTLRVR